MRALGVVVVVVILIAVLSAGVYAGRIAEIKATCPDGEIVWFCGILTAGFGECFYLQDGDVPVGIKVCPGLTEDTVRWLQPAAGEEPPVDLTSFLSTPVTEPGYEGGVVQTDSAGERYIKRLTRLLGCSAEMPAPLVLTNRYLGGCCFLCADGINIGQIGVYKGCGANTVGSLVQTSGLVMGHDAQLKCFYIDDGTMPFDGSGRRRIRVSYADLVPPYWVPSKYARVTVKGICTIYQDLYDLTRPMIRLRQPNDVQRSK